MLRPGILPHVQRRIAVFLTGLILIVVILAGRIAWIQLVEGQRLAVKVQNQLRENKVLQSPRGPIYDRNGRELAISILTSSLYVNPAEINKDPDTLTGLLAPVLGMKPEEIKSCLSEDSRFVWLKRALEPETAKKVGELINQYDIRGLGFIEESKRYYPNDSLAAQVLGFVGTDDIGLDGLEMSLDKIIKGETSEQVLSTDSHGTPIFQSIFAVLQRKPGKTVYTTIDSTIQFIVEQSLDKAIAQTNAQGATVIVMDPRTGDILAMANRPNFNPNQFYDYGPQAWRNRAVSNIYEPGSTFKSIVAAAALQEKLVRPDERFADAGYVLVSGRRIQNWSGDSYGNVSFIDIIKNSINTGFVQVGMRVGASKLNDYVRAFGFGRSTGIELPGEEEGILFNPQDMRDSDLATMSIGQSIAVTPLQLITAVSAIANNGVLMKPHIIKAVYDADGTLFSSTPPEPVRQVISPDTAQELAEMMEKVVSEGGGKKAAVKGYRFAGKTGTAQRLREDGAGYDPGRYIASFVGFGPVGDAQLSVLIVLDDPRGGNYYGGEIAAPVAHDILMQVVRYLNIHPANGASLALPAGNGDKTGRAAVVPKVVVPPGKCLVPNIGGCTIREAGEILNRHGLTFLPAGSGVAVSQSIAPNSIVDAGTEITVVFEPR